MALSTIDSVQPIPSILPPSSDAPAGERSTMFTDIFLGAIQNVKDTDAEKNKMEYLLATGQLDNPADLTIASSKAQISVELLVQLRNKALESYSELMRISL